MLNTAFALAVDHERVLCGEFTAGERATLLELLGRVGAQLGLAEGAHSGDWATPSCQTLRRPASTAGLKQARTRRIGVETEAELRTVRRLGVPFVHGFYLSRPGEPWPEIDAAANASVSMKPVRELLAAEVGAMELLQTA